MKPPVRDEDGEPNYHGWIEVKPAVHGIVTGWDTDCHLLIGGEKVGGLLEYEEAESIRSWLLRAGLCPVLEAGFKELDKLFKE